MLLIAIKIIQFMDQRINNSLKALVEQYSAADTDAQQAIATPLFQLFEADKPFMDKVARLDDLVSDHPTFEPLREVFFDLLLLNFLSADASKLDDDYLESEEWLDIEDRTLDRGTELLNLLLYLAECADEGLEPDLDDFLKEFLLVEDDEFQDEYRIYEPVISQQILVDSSFEEIGKAARKLSDDQELSQLFYPLMSFFFEPDPTGQDLEEYVQAAPRPEWDLAIYQLITHYNQ